MPEPELRARLGQVMVDAGLLSEAQLEAALAEQQRSGRPLGAVIVELGFASHGAVANALAEQSGGPIRTEHGFAIGLGRVHDPRPTPAPPVSALDLPVPPAGVAAAPPGLEPIPVEETATLKQQVAELQAALTEARRLLHGNGPGTRDFALEERDAAVRERDEAVRRLHEETARFVDQIVAIADLAEERVSAIAADRDALSARLARPLAPAGPLL